MFNCFILKVNGRVFGVFPNWETAKSIGLMLDGLEKIEYSIIEHYQENSVF